LKVLTSLAEDRYFLGLAALVNSVVKNGRYIDKIVVGYRGLLPTWLPKLAESKNGKSCTLACGICIEFVFLESNLHMVHEKPKWFKYLSHVLEPQASEYFFYDSDIVVINRMSFFGEWVKEGVAICEDVNYDMSYNHPIRQQWGRLAAEEGIVVNKKINRYYNSGFLGWTSENKSFIDDWERCFNAISKKSGDMKQFRVQDRTHTVLSANQDSLNLAAMTTNCPISIIGPEAMGFHYGLALMSHPTGAKPWNREYIKEFISGYPPRASDIDFWDNVNGSELNPLSNSYVKRKQILCKLLKGLGRFYQRSAG
jgi:hypothetical protein